MTNHFIVRRSQRRLPYDVHDVCRLYGRIIYQGRGRMLYYIGRKEVRSYYALGIDIRRYENCALVVNESEQEITVFKSPDFRRICKIDFKDHRRYL